MINLVTIDPSINSTGLTVNGEIFSIASEGIALTKKGALNKWFQLADDYATIETAKLDSYQRIADLVKATVDKHTNPNYNTLVLIEGYSYSSASGPLIDLVTLSTLIRLNMFSRKGTELVVFAPSTLKRLAGWLTYPEIAKGKKVIKLEYRNNEGVASGSFNKHQIYKALIENSNIQTEWVKFLRAHADEILEAKGIPKPIEDINDAVMLLHIASKVIEDKIDFQDTVDHLRTL